MSAAVALADIEGTGVANDACFVDTRTNRVIVAPVPGSGDRLREYIRNQEQEDSRLDQMNLWR
jgi:hypothetical protein